MITHDGVFRVENELTGWMGFVTVFCDDPAAAGRALARASPRLLRVLWTGREVAEQDLAAAEEEWRAAHAAGRKDADELGQFCEHVGEPRVYETGVRIYLDTRSELSQAAATAFFKILSEELTAEGIADARISADEP